MLMVTYPRYDLNEKIDDSDFGSILLDMSEPIQQVLPREFDWVRAS
jgi:hypothetical protein